MLKFRKGRVVAVALASAALAGAFSTPALATFDGTWSVSIVITRGMCESSPSLPIQISDGRVASGSSQVGVTGRVAQGGGITVTVIQGIKRAFGKGRLADASGAGTWNGGLCSGTWTAQRI